MGTVQPITPVEAKQQQEGSIPDQVFIAFNEILKKKFNGHSVTIRQDELVKLIMEQDGVSFSRNDLFNNHWLDIEEIYRKAGWKVEYDKPGYNESYEAYWVFTKK